MTILPGFLVFFGVFAVVFGVDRVAQDEEFPFQVSIQTRDNRHLCGGAIIAPRWVLTAQGCVAPYNDVKINYGSADTNNQEHFVFSERIVYSDLRKRGGLALIELRDRIEFSKTASQAKLPTSQVKLRNSTKLSGWKVNLLADVPSSLHVIDKFNVIIEDCRTSTGVPVNMAVDEFCGVDDDLSVMYLTNPGTTVSKSAIVLGLLAHPPATHISPVLFVKISEHGQWIKDVLGSDAQYISWVDTVPKDSAHSQFAVSLGLLGISTVLLRYL